MEALLDPGLWIAFLTLTALEIVLGVDNIIMIAILVDRLPPERRASARFIGLVLAMGTRIALLLTLSWMMRLTEPLFTVRAGQRLLRTRPDSFGWRPLPAVEEHESARERQPARQSAGGLVFARASKDVFEAQETCGIKATLMPASR
jgi:hypothetical protein